MNYHQLLRRNSSPVVLAGLVVFGTPTWGTAESYPAFDEVSGLVRSNLAGATPERIDWMAVQGLLSELSPRVLLVDNPVDPTLTAAEEPIVDRTQIYRDNVGYIHLDRILRGAASAVLEGYTALESSNHLYGLVLDLRGAGGEDYAAALDVADLFLSQEVPLLNWGEGLKSSKTKASAITVPVAVLVNGSTGGAAEALAAMLRQSGVALILGSRTAGTAGIQRDFPLSNGQFLKVTVAGIQLGNAQLISAEGVKPDVEVKVTQQISIADIGDVGDNQTEGLASNSNSAPPRVRMGEADLVRRWRGEMLSAKDLEKPSRVNGPENRDAVLVRALDLMDGLAILRSWQK